jgi:type III secretion protein J
MSRVLCVLLLIAAAGCRARVQSGLEERDANEIVSALASRGFEASKTPEKGRKPTFSVEVGSSNVTEAVRVLNELKLPRPARSLTRELVAQPGLVESPTAERARQLEGVEGDLEQALESLDGVASAAVELAIPLTPPRAGQPSPPARASVLLRVQADAQKRIDEQRESIRALVAGSVEGLRIDDVTLFIDAAQVRVPTLVQTIGPPKPLVWAVLVAMLAFAAGFIYLLLKQAWGEPVFPAPVPAPAPPRSKEPVVPAPALARTFVRTSAKAA